MLSINLLLGFIPVTTYSSVMTLTKKTAWRYEKHSSLFLYMQLEFTAPFLDADPQLL